MAHAGQLKSLARLVIIASVCWSCGTSSKAVSASATLRSAADATAQAHSFTLSLVGVDVTYEAPDRVQQVEHGQGSSATGSNGGSASSSGPFPVTITKVFIADRYYEADSAGGEDPRFTVAARCANDQNAAEYVLRLLRAVAASADVEGAGGSYTFRVPDQTGTALPTSGTATVGEGFVRSLTFTPGTSPVATVTIGSINTAPPVTAPASSSPVSYSCG